MKELRLQQLVVVVLSLVVEQPANVAQNVVVGVEQQFVVVERRALEARTMVAAVDLIQSVPLLSNV